MTSAREFGALLAELNRDELKYVVIGGVAVNLLGYERSTMDVDVIVPATSEQGEAIRRTVKRLGATRPDGSPLPDALFDGTHHIRARSPLGTIDFVPEGEPPLSFAEIQERARPDQLGDVPVSRVSLADLVALKRLADRPQDRDDLSRLEQAYGELPDSSERN